MELRQIVQWIIGTSVNLLVIICLVKTAWEGNDKAIIAVAFYYLVLIVANGLVGLVLKVFGSDDVIIWGTMILCLVILFPPVFYMQVYIEGIKRRKEEHYNSKGCKAKQLTTQNILHALHFDLKERRFKVKQQRTEDDASIERHAVYSNVSSKPS